MRLIVARAGSTGAALVMLLWPRPAFAQSGDDAPPDDRPVVVDPVPQRADPGSAADRESAVAPESIASPESARSPEAADAGAAATVAKVRAAKADHNGEVPFGFYRDAEGRVMQVSFDLHNRIWLGVAYAPRRRTSGQVEIAPAAFEFGMAYEETTPDGGTRHRFRVLDGEARLHPFGLDVTAFRYDLSHRYDIPILRVTTFFGEPERHDLYLNVGLFTEALHFDVAPRGLPGEYSLTLGTFQGTLDLWQSRDLRSFIRLRAGPSVEARLGSWGQDARFVGFLPQSILEGSAILGKRALQLLTFKLRGEVLRSLTVEPRALPWDWLVAAEGAWEGIIMAINDQPVSLRLAAQAGVRDDAGPAALPGAGPSPSPSPSPTWEWKGTAALRVSFFSPPVRPGRP